MKCPDCGTEMIRGEAGKGLPYDECPTCKAWWVPSQPEVTTQTLRDKPSRWSGLALKIIAALVNEQVISLESDWIENIEAGIVAVIQELESYRYFDYVIEGTDELGQHFVAVKKGR